MVARPTGLAVVFSVRARPTGVALGAAPRRAAAGARGAPQEPQDSEDPEDPGEHEDPGEAVELRVLDLSPSRSVCHLNNFHVLNLKCLISSAPVLSSDLHPAPWFRAFK